jgi:hypothetical protein
MSENRINCTSCRYSNILCDEKVLFPECLQDCTKNYVHHKYPHYKKWHYYKYLHWEPKDDISNYVLTDEDFEL